MKEEVFFEESQKFRQWWFFLLIFLIICVLAYYVHINFNSLNPVSTYGDFYLACLIACTGIILLFISNLKLIISNKGIQFKFFPLHWKWRILQWKRVEHIYVREWSMKEFRGRNFLKNFDTADYTVKGNFAIQVDLKNGRKYFFTTSKPEEVAEALQKVLINTSV